MSYIFVGYKETSTSGGCGRGCCSPTYHDSEFICEDDLERSRVIELVTNCLYVNKLHYDAKAYRNTDPWEIIIFLDGKKISGWLDDQDVLLEQDYKSIMVEAGGLADESIAKLLEEERAQKLIAINKAVSESEAMELALFESLKKKFSK